MKYLRFCLFFLTLFFSIFFFNAKSVFADNYYPMLGVSVANTAQGGVSLDAEATLVAGTEPLPYQSFSSGCAGSACVGRISMFSGTYPDTSSSVCGSLAGYWYSVLYYKFLPDVYGEYPYLQNCWNNGGGSTGDGNYWVRLQTDSSNTNFMYFSATRAGGLWSGGSAPVGPPPDGITSQLTPVSGSSVPYNVTFTGTYDNYAGTYRTIIITATTGSPAIYSSVSGTLETGTGLSYSLPLLLSPNQTYNYHVEMCDSSGYPCTTPTTDVSFSTNGLTGAISPPVWVAETCTWTDFSTWTGCLDNVGHGLFSPTTESLNQFGSLYEVFKYKPPFGYVFAIQTALAGVNDTGTAAFTLTSMPILNTDIFDPIRLALTWILWVAFAFVFYHRVKNLAL